MIEKLKAIVILVCTGTIVHLDDQSFGGTHDSCEIVKYERESNVEIFGKRGDIILRN